MATAHTSSGSSSIKDEYLSTDAPTTRVPSAQREGGVAANNNNIDGKAGTNQADGDEDMAAAATRSREFQDAIKEAAANKPKRTYILVSVLCIFAAMGGFMFGFDTGTISGYVNMPVYQQRFGEQRDNGEWYFSNVRQGLIIGMFSIGATIGGIVLSRLGDTHGRKLAIMCGATIYIVGSLIQITAVNKWYQIMIGRIICGLGIGQLAVIVPMFQAETAPEAIRGALVCSFQLMVTLGIFVGYCICYGTNTRVDTGAYRIPLGLNFLWALLMIIGTIFLPESPRFLVSVDRVDEAIKAMCFSNSTNPEDPLIKMGIDEIVAANAYEREIGKARWIELITGQPKVFWRVVIGVVVCSIQQLTGANYFFYYSTTLFKGVGMQNSFAASMIIGGVNFGSTCFSLYTVDKFGRRKCLLFGSTLCFVMFCIYSSLGVTKLYPNGYDAPSDPQIGKGMIVCTCFFIFGFAVSWAPIAYVMASELYPLRIKSKGMSVAIGSNWIFNFLLAMFTPMITGAIHYAYGYVFTGCLVFSFFFVWFCVPETQGLVLEQIDEMFASGVPAWKSASWVPSDHVQPSHEYNSNKKEATEHQEQQEPATELHV